MKAHTIVAVLASVLTINYVKGADQIVVGSCISAIFSPGPTTPPQIFLEPSIQGDTKAGTLTSGMRYRATAVQNGYVKVEGTDSSYSFVRGAEIGWVKADRLQIRDQEDCANRF